MYASNELRSFQYHCVTVGRSLCLIPVGLARRCLCQPYNRRFPSWSSDCGYTLKMCNPGCWAAMLKFGYSGYADSSKRIIACRATLQHGLASIPELSILGDPRLSVVAFCASGTNARVSVYPLADLLSRLGWHLNVLQFPPAIHVACTLPTINGVDDLIRDVKDSVELLKRDPDAGKGSVAAIYGTAASVPDRAL